jgi:bacterioferritin
VIGYLGRALSLELSAVQQYMAHAALTQAWGMADASQHWRSEADEEMRHAERIVHHMITLGVAPNASQLRQVRCGRTLAELVEHNRRMEMDIVALYQDATLACLRSGDAASEKFFRGLLEEEIQHAQDLEAWLQMLHNGGVSAMRV